jgi:hypothetical protein
MGRYTELLGEYDAETTTYSAFAGGAGASPYTPKKDGTLVGLRVMVSRDAATSLTDHVQIKLTCTTFNPNAIEVGATGTGLQTAPAFVTAPVDWPVNQPVKAGVPITLEGRNVTADTPITNCVLLYGIFQ